MVFKHSVSLWATWWLLQRAVEVLSAVRGMATTCLNKPRSFWTNFQKSQISCIHFRSIKGSTGRRVCSSDHANPWKEATESFRLHETRKCHKIAVEKIITLPNMTPNIVIQFNWLVRETNWHCLMKFLARQFFRRVFSEFTEAIAHLYH